MATVSIIGLNKAEVLAALYNNARPQGMGFLQYDPNPMSESEEDGTLWSFSHRSDPLMWLRFRAELERTLQQQRKKFYSELERMSLAQWDVTTRDSFIDELYPLPAMPKKSKIANTVRGLDISSALLTPVLNAGDAATKIHVSRVELAEANRKGIKELAPQYEEQFGQTLYATYQATTDWLCWSKMRGTWGDVAENVMFNTRFQDTQRLMKMSRKVINNN